MADIDLYGNDAQRIRNQYRTSLRRDASDDEVSGWLSGSYGGGGVDNWLQQISQSHEAQQHNAPPPQPQQPQQQPPSHPQPPVVGQPNPNTSGPMTGGGGMDPGFSQSLQEAYQRYLGRGASENELTNWWSGQYGHGQGYSGLGAFREAIRTSGEAAGRNNGQAPPNARQDTHWWQTQGVNETDIFDTTTGQLRPGWERYEGGYRRAGGAGGAGAPNVPGPQNGDFESWFMSLTNGRPPTPEELERLAPTLQQFGIRIGSKGNRGWSDTITLPDGRMYDLIEGAGIGTGKKWQWLQVGGPGYVPQGGNGGGVGGGPLPGNQYSDQYTQLMEELIKTRIGMLQGGINDPMRDQYMAALDARTKALAGAEPEYQALIERLEKRFQDLQGPGYTGAENEAVRTGALDPIEQDRTAARQRVLERLAARGLDPNSGIAQQALLEVDKAFDGMRATTQTTLTTNDLARREDRATRADSIKGTLYDIPQARAREQLDVFSAMEILEQAFRNEQQANSREAIGYGGALADLGPQRMQLAMQAAGMGGNPQSMFNSLYQMMNMNQNAALLNQRNSGQLWSGLGSLAYSLMNAGR